MPTEPIVLTLPMFNSPVTQLLGIVAAIAAIRPILSLLKKIPFL